MWSQNQRLCLQFFLRLPLNLHSQCPPRRTPCALCHSRPDMCSTSECDLEDIPLEDDDPNSLEFKILAFYARHHVFKSTPAVFSPKLSRTRSLSQKALGTWSTDSWTQVPSPCRSSPSSEKYLTFGKKKSSWRTFFRAAEKEEGPPSSPKEVRAQGAQSPFVVQRQGLQNQHWARSLSNVEQRLEAEGRLCGGLVLTTVSVHVCAKWSASSYLLKTGLDFPLH